MMRSLQSNSSWSNSTQTLISWSVTLLLSSDLTSHSLLLTESIPPPPQHPPVGFVSMPCYWFPVMSVEQIIYQGKDKWDRAWRQSFFSHAKNDLYMAQLRYWTLSRVVWLKWRYFYTHYEILEYFISKKKEKKTFLFALSYIDATTWAWDCHALI